MRLLPVVALAVLAACGGLDESSPPAGDGAAALSCSTSRECATKDPNSVCRRSDLKCVPLLTPECPRLLGDRDLLLGGDAVLVGAITPAGVSDLGDAVEKSVALAQRELSGIPRPVVIVACNEIASGGREPLLEGAKHLVDDLAVPVVIGPAGDVDAQLVASSVTVPRGVLEIAPDAISSAMASPLVWRLNGSDRQQLDVLRPFLTQELIPKLVADGALAKGEDLRVAFLREIDGAGLEAGRAVRDGLSPEALVRDVAIEGARAGTTDPLAASLLANGGSSAPPHVVVHAYSTFGPPAVLSSIESQWKEKGASAPRPYHIALLPGGGSQLLGLIDASRADAPSGQKPLEQRLFAVAPQPRPATRQVEELRLRLESQFPDLQGTAASGDPVVRRYYDAVYLAAFAVAALGGKAVTGSNLAATLPRLVGGTSVLVGPSEIGHALSLLGDPAESIHLDGVSGDLARPLAAGAPGYDEEVTCPGRSPDGRAASFVGSGLSYDEVGGSLLGRGSVFDPTRTGCPYLR